MTRRAIAALLAALTLAACGGESHDNPNGETPTEVDSAAGIQATLVDGVWLFYHDPDGWNDALFTGTPSVVNGCLFVGDAIVVWHVERRDASEEALALARRGEGSPLRIGGGGISLDEGNTPLPSLITERCSTRLVWFGAP
jgi:hypothetical protein